MTDALCFSRVAGLLVPLPINVFWVSVYCLMFFFLFFYVLRVLINTNNWLDRLRRRYRVNREGFRMLGAWQLRLAYWHLSLACLFYAVMSKLVSSQIPMQSPGSHIIWMNERIEEPGLYSPWQWISGNILSSLDSIWDGLHDALPILGPTAAYIYGNHGLVVMFSLVANDITYSFMICFGLA